MRSKFRQFVSAHKVISAIALVIVIGGGYWWYSSASTPTTVTTYVVQAATLGTVVSSVSGSGQMQATSQINIQPQVTEAVTGVYVKPGDHVRAGQLLVQLDPTNEERAVAQAQLSLQNAQLSLEQLQSISTTTLLSDQSAVIQGKQNVLNASTTLATDYENGYDTLGTVFVSLQTVMTDAGNFTTGYNITKSQQNPQAYVNVMPSYLQAATQPYADAISPAYTAALAAYQANLADYKNASRNSPPATLDSLFAESYHTTQLVAQSVQAISNLLNFVVNNYPADAQHAPLPAITATFETTYGNDVKTANAEVTTVQGLGTTIATDENNLTNDQLSLGQASETLAELVGGPTALQIQTQQVSIQSAQDNLTTAQENLADCSIRAPISGIISAVPSTVGGTVPSPAVSMVGDEQVAEITLNEVDAANVAVGQHATLTFDAINGLSLAGTVVEVDPVGTVSQGVVNYGVQVSLANSSGTAEVKPGMSVTANIVTAVRENVVAVPNAAVTTHGSVSYVTEPATPLPTSTLAASENGGVELPAVKQVQVTVGLSNDTLTEIVSGVKPGDEIITQTVNGSSAAAVTTGNATGRFGGGAGGALFPLGGR